MNERERKRRLTVAAAEGPMARAGNGGAAQAAAAGMSRRRADAVRGWSRERNGKRLRRRGGFDHVWWPKTTPVTRRDVGAVMVATRRLERPRARERGTRRWASLVAAADGGLVGRVWLSRSPTLERLPWPDFQGGGSGGSGWFPPGDTRVRVAQDGRRRGRQSLHQAAEGTDARRADLTSRRSVWQGRRCRIDAGGGWLLVPGRQLREEGGVLGFLQVSLSRYL
ncbi:putative serine/arginine-rich splicing factor SR45 isoform X2 [Iris pallida]|uniref:Serine/arginine-rich splicing factor SR45 isoform X2 n=1 Tax=Iris pallida TaxID=29817 RepID=A0AAX6I3K5_IRIPA|nr:putative serine/arginine-rich splicing factor SR45 isoform X2 [Iris pallida]